MKNIKRISLTIALCIACLGITACTDIDGKLMKESDVLKEVKEQVPSERFKYIKVEHHDDLSPKEDIYYFESKDRDMSFQALSTLAPIGIDASVIGYRQYLDVGYDDGVHSLYLDQIDSILNQITKDEKDNYCFTSYTELEKVIQIVAKADAVYSAEKKYNTEKWMEEHPVKNVRLYYRYKNEEGEDKSFSMLGINLTGLESYEKMHDLYTYQYVKRMMAEGFEDPTIPEEAYTMIHPDKLPDIYINQYNISETAYIDAKSKNLTNNSRDKNGNDHYAAYYYYHWDTYVVPLNVGLTDENYAPKLVEEYFKVLGIDYEIKYGKGDVRWNYNGDKWLIEAKMDKNHDNTSCEFYKNGKRQDINYLTHNDVMSPVNATYLIGISVQDFADMFGLEYDINEAEGTLKFYSDEAYRQAN